MRFGIVFAIAPVDVARSLLGAAAAGGEQSGNAQERAAGERAPQNLVAGEQLRS